MGQLGISQYDNANHVEKIYDDIYTLISDKRLLVDPVIAMNFCSTLYLFVWYGFSFFFH